jgi:hypothetical protein
MSERYSKPAEPSVFNGIPSKFLTWLHQIRIYLAVNTANYTTGWMKTFFVLSYMKEGAANAWAKEYQVSRDYSTTDYILQPISTNTQLMPLCVTGVLLLHTIL